MSKTVKVRVAVALDDCGEWSAHGQSGLDDMTALCVAEDSVGERSRTYWLTAELLAPEKPAPAEIDADVEPQR